MASKSVIVGGLAPEAVRAAVRDALRPMAEAAGYAVADAVIGGDKAAFDAAASSSPAALIAVVDDAAGFAARDAFGYTARVIYSEECTPAEAAQYLAEALFSQPMRAFVSTRQPAGEGAQLRFLDAVRQGLAKDGGLFLPTQIATPFPLWLLKFLATAEAAGDYARLAQVILERIVDREQVPPCVLQGMLARAYDVAAWSGETARCPLADVTFAEAREAGMSVALSQQYCGPTSAFKDFALQLFPQWFARATKLMPSGEVDESATDAASKYLILAATSGDTGGAAINGFVRGAPEIKTMVLYPTKGVSPVQRLQMLAMNGGSVRVVAVDADFDFCQSTVKRIFNDQQVAATLAETTNGTRLSSANSINWGRLLPQLVYYFANYCQLAREKKLAFGEPMDVCVPTGNFGNILACYLAKRLGLPVGRLVLASNNNDVLHEFVSTGVYDIAQRSLDLTASPSIDILKASNVERFLFLATGGDGAAVREMMDSLATSKRFDVPEAVREQLKSTFWSGKCDEATCRAAVKKTYDECKVVIDPHTAVAMEVARQYVTKVDAAQRAKVLLVASTAHWAKFPEPVAEGLGAVQASELKGNAASADDIRALYARVAATAPEAKVSEPLAKIFQSEGLAETGDRFPAEYDAIVKDLLAFAAQPSAAH